MVARSDRVASLDESYRRETKWFSTNHKSGVAIFFVATISIANSTALVIFRVGIVMEPFALFFLLAFDPDIVFLFFYFLVALVCGFSLCPRLFPLPSLCSCPQFCSCLWLWHCHDLYYCCGSSRRLFVLVSVTLFVDFCLFRPFLALALGPSLGYDYRCASRRPLRSCGFCYCSQ
jgi:hypothetical protein